DYIGKGFDVFQTLSGSFKGLPCRLRALEGIDFSVRGQLSHCQGPHPNVCSNVEADRVGIDEGPEIVQLELRIVARLAYPVEPAIVLEAPNRALLAEDYNFCLDHVTISAARFSVRLRRRVSLAISANSGLISSPRVYLAPNDSAARSELPEPHV